MKIYIRKILFYPFLLMIFSSGCGDNDNNSGSSPRTSEHLFELGLSPTELANRKGNFLNKNSLHHPSVFLRRLVNLNDSNLNRYHTCPAPKIGNYTAPDGGAELYCIQIPKEFRNNIPKEIKQEIISHDLDTLEIFFTAQHRNETNNPPSVSVFRVHNWVYPHIPVPFTIANGTIFNRDVLMTVYPNSAIHLSNQIIERKLLPFNVNLHDGLISPNNAHTAIASAPAQNFSFYSLVIDPPTKRAVVTLHWIIGRNDFLDDVTNAAHATSLQNLNSSIPVPTSLQVLIGRIQALVNFAPAASEPMRSLIVLLH